MTTTPEVSVVLPVFDEVETLEPCISGIVDVLQAQKMEFEIVAIDDGSKDGSLELLRQLQVSYPGRLRVVAHLRNRGSGAALRTGIRVSCGEVVVCMDADGQHQPAGIPELLAKIPPFDMVVGARTSQYQGAWYRNLANRIYNRFASWLTQFPIEDLTSGLRAFRRSAVLHFLPLYPSGFSAPTTVTLAFLKAGYSVAYVPVEVLPRRQGKSKIRLWRDGQRFILIILRMITLYDPMRIFLPVTAALGLLGLVSWIVGMAVAGRLVVPGSTVVLFIAAVLALLLGLVSSQIANTAIPYFGDEYTYEYSPQAEPPDVAQSTRINP